jgi:hypothetical protein
LQVCTSQRLGARRILPKAKHLLVGRPGDYGKFWVCFNKVRAAG